MTDQQIALFLSLVEIGSVTKTADEHYVSQPVVSKQIAALESALGFQLFNRRHKKVSVSASGQVFYDFFKRASLEYPAVVAHARRVQEAEFGSVELGLHSLLRFPAVERAVERLSEKYPNAKIRTHSHTVPFWQDEVSSGEIDVAVSDVPSTETHPGLASLELDRVREYLVYSADHPLAGKEDLSFSDFAQETFFFLLTPKHPSFPITRFNKLCDRFGIACPEILFAPENETIQNYVAKGKGVSIVKYTDRVAARGDGLRYLDIDASIPVCLLWNPESLSPLGLELVQAIGEEMKK